MKVVLLLMVSLSIAACGTDPVKEKRRVFFDKETATAALGDATGLNFSGSFNLKQFRAKMFEKKIVINEGKLNTAYARCIKDKGYEGKYSVKSISLNAVDKALHGSIDIAFDTNSNYICFEIFQPKL